MIDFLIIHPLDDLRFDHGMVKMFSLFQFDFSSLEKLICLGIDPIGDDAFRRLVSQSTID